MLNVLKEKNFATNTNIKAMKMWFDECNLPIAPSCNMMCNFCSKDSDCVCNGNNPTCLSKSMTPRQAVNYASSTVNKNNRTRIIKISGPGEPLCNRQTFEVLKRLNSQQIDCALQINTNGILLDEKVEELAKSNVKIINVSMNAIYEETFKKLYSRIIRNENILVDSQKISNTMLEGQIAGIEKCIKYGITVKVNSIYYPSINEDDIIEIARFCRNVGVKSLCITAGINSGKMKNIKTPSEAEITNLSKILSLLVKDVEIKSLNLNADYL